MNLSVHMRGAIVDQEVLSIDARQMQQTLLVLSHFLQH